MRLFAPCLLLALSAPLTAQLSAPVPLPGDVALGLPAGSQSFADVARGSDSFLVVWEDTRSSLTGSVAGAAVDVYGMRYDASGQALDAAPFIVAGGPLRQYQPRVAWNGSEWLVAFLSERWLGFTEAGVYAVRVDVDGSVLDTAPILIDDSDFQGELDPSVVTDGTGSGWVVSWYDVAGNGNRQRKLARVSSSGAILATSTLYNTSQNNYPFRGQMAFGGGQILFVAERQSEIIARRVDPVTLQPLAAHAVLTSDGSYPAVASDGVDFYVAWRRQLVFDEHRGTTVSASGIIGSPGGDMVAVMSGAGADLRPAVAWDGDHYWLAVDQLTTGNRRVEGYRLDALGAPVDAGAVVLSDTALPNHSIIVGGILPGTLFAAWQDAGAGSEDLFGSVVAGTSTTPLGSLELSPGAQTASDVAGDADAGYLLVYNSLHSGSSRVVGLHLDDQGVPSTGLPFTIEQTTAGVDTPRVSWNGQDWLVVWESSGLVRSRRVAADGSLPDPVAVTQLVGNTPDVAALGSEFLVVASRLTSLDIRRIRAQRVSATGASIGPEFVVGEDYSRFPRVEAVGGRWLVAWQHKLNHDAASGKAQFRFVDASGTADGDAVVAGSAERVGLAVLGDTFAVGRAYGDFAVNRFDSNGVALSSNSLFVSTAPLDQLLPVMGSDGNRFLSAWTDYRIHGSNSEGQGDVFGARFGIAGGLFQDELAVADDPMAPETAGSIAGADGSSLWIHHRFVSDGTVTGWRAFLRVLQEAAFCQQDIGFGGSSGSQLSLCGTGLGSGEVSNLHLLGGPELSLTLLVMGFQNQPIALLGGLLVPSDAAHLELLATNQDGELFVPNIAGGHPLSPTVYLQALSADPFTGAAVFSNAIEAQFTP